MKIGVIADDFTGASDIALTLAEAGMSVAQFIGVPDHAIDPTLDAGVVALKSRTAPVGDAIAQSTASCTWLRAQGAEQIILKICSTFDSTSEGNIGPVLDALANELGANAVIVCPAFPENGRSVYQGHLFVGDRLLNQSGLENHPLTPMRDADLRRVLAAQSVRPVDHISMTTVSLGAAEIAQALNKPAHFIVDAISDNDLREIGRAANGTALLCGGSGIAIGLPNNFGLKPKKPRWTGRQGRGVILSGSCSNATRSQVDRYKETAPWREILVADAVAEAIDVDELAEWVAAQDREPLIYSSARPETVLSAQEKFGRERSAHAIELVFSQLAQALVARDVTKFVVAGGETSGAVVAGLDVQELRIGPRVAAGVPLMATETLSLVLKSGNFGGEDFFAEALKTMVANQ